MRQNLPNSGITQLFDHLVGIREQSTRRSEARRLCSLEMSAAKLESRRVRRPEVSPRGEIASSRDHTGNSDKLCRSGMFLASSSLGIRFLTSSFPFSTRLM